MAARMAAAGRSERRVTAPWPLHRDLGVGLGLRAAHVDDLCATAPDIGWLELVAENYLVDGGRPLESLERIGRRYPLVVHAVGLYVGSADGVDRAHLARVRGLADRVDARWVTDHLCWGAVDGRTSHDLLPLPYTREVAALCADAIRAVQDTLGRPFAIENVSSYAQWRESTMTEWDFVAEVAEAADCGILLDVNNVYVSATNHGWDPQAYLARLPASRIAQLHLAGHAPHDGYLIDTHDRAVADPVWALYADAVARFGPAPTLLEWDADLPPLATLLDEAARARAIAATATAASAMGAYARAS